MSGLKVAMLMGSISDKPVLEAAAVVLHDLGIPFEWRVLSAHRTPSQTHEYIRDAEARGAQVFICAAGMAAHLAGVVASSTTRPVLGVPIAASMNGLDALLSTVQMPGGVPVATFAIGRAGAKNAAWFAAQLLALSDAGLAERLRSERVLQANDVLAASEQLQAELPKILGS